MSVRTLPERNPTAPAETEAVRMADRLRLLHTVTAPSDEPLSLRITRALALTATLLDLDLGVFSQVEGDRYTVVAVNTPDAGVVSGDTFALDDTYCAIALGRDDLFAVTDARRSPVAQQRCYAAFGFERYIGLPVRVGGAVYGTICFSSPTPGDPFTEADADLLRVLASWVGAAVEQDRRAAALAENAALVRGLYDASPLLMGVVEITGTADAPDLLYRSCNAATAALFGRPMDAIVGHTARELGVPEDAIATWSAAYRRAAASGAPVSAEYAFEGPGGTVFLSSTTAVITPSGPDTPARYCFVATDVTEQCRDREALEASERRARTLGRATFEGIAFSRDGLLMDANDQFAALLGYTSRDALIGSSALDFVAPASRARVRQMIGEGRTEAYEAEVIRADGSVFWAEIQGRTIPYADGAEARVTAVRDITARKAAERQIHFQASVLAHVSDAVVALDLDGRVTYWNGGAERLHGLAASDVLGRPLDAVVRYAVPDAPDTIAAPDALREGAGGDLHYRTPGGERRTVSVSASVLRDGDGRETGVLAVLRDVTAEREMAAQMAHQALHDALTGLPNRVRFRQHVEHCLRGGAPFSVLYVDLDHFKTVNDTLGHDAGDRLLLTVAGRMQAAAGPDALVARLGGDEFALAIPGATRDARRAADRLLRAIAAPVELGQREHTPGASIGLVRHAERYASPEDLLRDADTAMYTAKRSGRGRVAVFDAAMHAAVAERFGLEHELRTALRDGQFGIHLQPIVDLQSGAVAGFEALARWHHPTRGLLAPGHFIDVAEDLGLIAEIDGLVLEATCREIRRWGETRDLPSLLTMVNVNCSDQTFLDAGLAARARAAAEAAGIPPDCLTLELTERALVATDVAGGLADTIRASGLRLCVDDFGSGYSSLGLLHRLTVDGLKIDRSFVTDLGTSPAAQAVVRAVVQFSADLGLRTVAEGIETADQLRVLRAMGCRYGQGYLFSPPVAPETARAMLDAPPWMAAWPGA